MTIEHKELIEAMAKAYYLSIATDKDCLTWEQFKEKKPELVAGFTEVACTHLKAVQEHMPDPTKIDLENSICWRRASLEDAKNYGDLINLKQDK